MTQETKRIYSLMRGRQREKQIIIEYKEITSVRKKERKRERIESCRMDTKKGDKQSDTANMKGFVAFFQLIIESARQFER